MKTAEEWVGGSASNAALYPETVKYLREVVRLIQEDAWKAGAEAMRERLADYVAKCVMYGNSEILPDELRDIPAPPSKG